MHRRPPAWPVANVCWRCQWRIANQRRRISSAYPIASHHASKAPLRPARRAFHATQLRPQTAVESSPSSTTLNPVILDPSYPIRHRLQLWQEERGGPNEDELKAFENYEHRHDIANGMSSSYLGRKSDEVERGDEQEEDNADFEGDDLITIGLFLKPGDVVEITSANREPVLAVYVQQFNTRSQFFSSNGRWCHGHIASISFAIPGCISPALVHPLIPYLPTKPGAAEVKGTVQVPRELGAPVQDRLEHLMQESEKIYRENATVLDTAYSRLADETRTRMMTLTQIAKILLASRDPAWASSPAALLAVRKALHHNEFRFRSDTRSQRLTNVFAIRPKNEVQVVETVQEWVRQYEEDRATSAKGPLRSTEYRSEGARHIAAFADKVRRLVALSRKQRDPSSGYAGPSKDRRPQSVQSAGIRSKWGEEFSSTDKQIINFLQAWCLTNQFTNMHGLWSACSTILLASGCYEGTITLGRTDDRYTEDHMGRESGFLLLQEIGVLSPYENHIIYDEQLMLPTVRLSRNLELLNTKAELTRRNPDFRDSMADLRHDWGDEDVYCIDSVGAQEIDDGVSISKVPGTSSEYWLHVHVANPTAFFDKTHVLSGLAAHMTETVYVPERSFPMLPTWATQNYFSLGRNRPALTFSTRLDISGAGAILERKIQSSIIRRVTSITPTELSELLGETAAKPPKPLVVGGELPSTGTRSSPQLTPHQLQDFKDLYTVALKLWDMRKAAGSVRIWLTSTRSRVFEKPGQDGLTWAPPSTDRSRTVHGDPIIAVEGCAADGSILENIDSSSIVEEMMILAGTSAGTWCAERNIPVMYRGTVETPLSIVESFEKFKKEVMEPHIAKHGRLSRALVFKYMDAVGRSIAHSSPLPHAIMGSEAYVKVTSPLRRFSDMIAHWQIEAALRYEFRTGKKFDAKDTSTSTTSSSRPVLPFSQRQMQESIVTLSPREKLIASTKRRSTHFWAVMAFMRAFYYKEAELPETFRVWIREMDLGKPHAQGWLVDYGVFVRVKRPTGVDIQVGDEWESRIEAVSVFRGEISMEALRLVQREEEM